MRPNSSSEESDPSLMFEKGVRGHLTKDIKASKTMNSEIRLTLSWQVIVFLLEIIIYTISVKIMDIIWRLKI